MKHHQLRRTVLASAALSLLGALSSPLVLAQSAGPAANYPSKPIRLVVPFTPGGSSDILARAVGQELTKAWGQSVVIDNVASTKQVSADSGMNVVRCSRSIVRPNAAFMAQLQRLHPAITCMGN